VPSAPGKAAHDRLHLAGIIDAQFTQQGTDPMHGAIIIHLGGPIRTRSASAPGRRLGLG
jgi:hypothetical protein